MNMSKNVTNKKILIVDDDPYILMSLDFLMKKNKFEVFVARNGNEALEQIKTNQPDLILLDIMMPDVDGYEICIKVKSDNKTKDIIIVFMSAKTRDTDIQKGLDLGAALYITKPFSTRDLLEKVIGLLS
ncbi:MAG: response regulator [Saprospiraceae bacterium]|jgi:DNA-binding response OmpR family regulator|nr:response regulator [Saprospiraceae bacterium]